MTKRKEIRFQKAIDAAKEISDINASRRGSLERIIKEMIHTKCQGLSWKAPTNMYKENVKRIDVINHCFLSLEVINKTNIKA